VLSRDEPRQGIGETRWNRQALNTCSCADAKGTLWSFSGLKKRPIAHSGVLRIYKPYADLTSLSIRSNDYI